MIVRLKRAFRSYKGRHYTSRWVRMLFDQTKAQKRIGYFIAFAVLFFIIIEPTVYAVADEVVKPTIPPNEILKAEEVKTETTIVWPVKHPKITQGFTFGHRGIDMQDSDLTIYPVDKGTVTRIERSRLGYGNHLYIDHGNGKTSLYAHFNSIAVSQGQEVTRETPLGIMGRTGWASGIHLHLEIFQDGKVFNPLALLPTLSQAIAVSK